ncbi:uncharacterized protein LOC131010225 [Salvia miltiorrhiza]|uniref:uncharacterized protein LOC131010225 n=1 Tax=Salvia miltiorrhiza TaxID=226208 RepID=UPI0025AD721F|nr:uncharacterized protein LOC131010225 [Salvia miltiorrhiza]
MMPSRCIMKVSTFVVYVKTNMNGQNKCSCLECYISGIPCKHACAAIRFMDRDPTDFVSGYFTMATYLSGYEFGIKRIVGNKMWPEVKSDVVKPPPKTRMAGCPKKKRVRAPQEKEWRMTRHVVVMSCSKCKQTEHNKRKCSNPALENPNPNKAFKGWCTSKRKQGKRRRQIQPRYFVKEKGCI